MAASEKIIMPVHGGLCQLEFRADCSTGPQGSDSHPGVGFDFVSETGRLHKDEYGKYWGGTGVIGRSDCRKLRDLLDEFLSRNP